MPDGKTQRLPDDIMELVDQLESRVAKAEEEDPEDLFDVEEELELASTAKADFEDAYSGVIFSFLMAVPPEMKML